MDEWQVIPEIVGCNAGLRIAVSKAMEAIEQGRHLVLEGETGTGRRLLAHSAWYQRRPGAGSLFTLDCRIFPADEAETLLFGGRSASDARAPIRLGKLNLATCGGLLLLNAEYLSLKTQLRLAQTLGQDLLEPRGEKMQLLMTCAPSSHSPLLFHPELAVLLMRMRLPALRERVEDIRAIAEAFLRHESPFQQVGCSQALIDRFCAYPWPGNVLELRSVLRRLLLEPHDGLLDLCHLADLMCRDANCFSPLQADCGPGARTGYSPFGLAAEPGSMQ